MTARNVVLAVVFTLGTSASAFAKSEASPTPITPIPSSRMLADIEVVTPPPTTAPAPAPAPVAAPVVVPVEQAPAPRSQKVVHEDVQPSRNYMGTVAVSALMGGVAGALVGGAIYYLGDQQNARNIGFWAAGGVLVGTGVGVAQILVQEDRATRAVSQAGTADPAPTHRLALMRLRF